MKFLFKKITITYLKILSNVATSEMKDIFSFTTQLVQNRWMTTCQYARPVLKIPIQLILRKGRIR